MKLLAVKELKKWRIALIELEAEDEQIYLVSRRYPELSVAHTKVFTDKNEAKRQFQEWTR